MPVSVTLPALGESVTEGTVTRWLKAEGERVEADEPLLEVSTDKVDTEIPAPASGVLSHIKVAEDETVEVGAELAVIDDGTGAPAEGPRPPPRRPPPPRRRRPPPRRRPRPGPGGRGRPRRPPPRHRPPRPAAPRAPTSRCPRWASRSPRAPSPAG